MAWECPNVVWELTRRNGFCWWEDDMLYATPGVAVALINYDGEITSDFVDRRVRAEALGMEWSELMHFEMAINHLFAGWGVHYNEVAHWIDLPKISKSYYSRITAENFDQLKQILA